MEKKISTDNRLNYEEKKWQQKQNISLKWKKKIMGKILRFYKF